MVGRVAPAALLGVAALADLGHAGSLAFYLLLAAVPVAAAASLNAFGDLVDGRAASADEGTAGVGAAFSTLAVALTVFAGALHASVLFGGTAPRASLPVAVAALAAAGIAAAVRPARTGAAGGEARSEADELFEAA
jgi:hypothetical protein